MHAVVIAFFRMTEAGGVKGFVRPHRMEDSGKVGLNLLLDPVWLRHGRCLLTDLLDFRAFVKLFWTYPSFSSWPF
jgi:hypothetical protein